MNAREILIKSQARDRSMKNSLIAAAFYDMADLLDILGVEWKPLAFRKAARTLEGMTDDIEDLYTKKGMKGLTELPGIGEGIGKKIVQYLEKRKIDEYEELQKQIPEGVRELLSVPGLGPKKVARLYKELKIDSLKKLEEAVKKEKIRTLSGFGEKSEEDILMGLELVKKGTERKLVGIVYPYAQALLSEIRKIPSVEKAELAGSMRRMRETVKDLDILVITKKERETVNEIKKLSESERVESAGDTKITIRLKMGLSCEVSRS